jgi:hypothetical protein
MKRISFDLFKEPEKHIPKGPYCYRADYKCPFLDSDSDREAHESGYCHFLKLGDWMENGTSLLWDQCKECGINWEDENEDFR